MPKFSPRPGVRSLLMGVTMMKSNTHCAFSVRTKGRKSTTCHRWNLRLSKTICLVHFQDLTINIFNFFREALVAAKAIEDHVEIARVLYDERNYDWFFVAKEAGDMIGKAVTGNPYP